jgi:hypothetical protein
MDRLDAASVFWLCTSSSSAKAEDEDERVGEFGSRRPDARTFSEAHKQSGKIRFKSSFIRCSENGTEEREGEAVKKTPLPLVGYPTNQELAEFSTYRGYYVT